jgi:hypothetical protein
MGKKETLLEEGVLSKTAPPSLLECRRIFLVAAAWTKKAAVSSLLELRRMVELVDCVMPCVIASPRMRLCLCILSKRSKLLLSSEAIGWPCGAASVEGAMCVLS